jgi:hypothetical protein
MTNAAHSMRKSNESDENTITKLARQTHAEIEVVRHLYDEEIATLQKDATVKGFIGVIAARRVKRRLLGGETRAHRSHHPAK